MTKKIVFALIITVTALTGCSSGGKLSASEQLALDFVNQYLNSTDEEAKEAFLEEKIHPDAQVLFRMMSSLGAEEDQTLNNPKVIETQSTEDEDGQKADTVLLRGERGGNANSEAIVLISEEKVLLIIQSSGELFTQARATFKEPIPSAAAAE